MADDGGLGSQQQQEEVEYDPSKDLKRKAKSNDPGWKYGFWPDMANKDLVECMLCGKQMHSGIKRLKQHLAAGFGDVQKCPNTTMAIMREMQGYMKKTARTTKIIIDDDEVEQGKEQDDEVQVFEVSQQASQA